DKMLKSTQRLVAFAIIHHAYSSQQPSSNPLISFLVNAACDDEAEKCERAFILQLLGSASCPNSKEVLQQSAVDYMNNFDLSSHVSCTDTYWQMWATTYAFDFKLHIMPKMLVILVIETVIWAFPQREQLQQQYCDKVHTLPFNCLFKNSAVKNVVPDPDVPRGCDENSPEFDMQPGVKPKIGSGNRDETLIGSLQNLSLEGLGPRWIRPCPPRLPIQDGELVWLNPDNNHELLWDYGMCADTSKGAAVRDLIAKALKGPLAPAQQEENQEGENKKERGSRRKKEEKGKSEEEIDEAQFGCDVLKRKKSMATYFFSQYSSLRYDLPSSSSPRRQCRSRYWFDRSLLLSMVILDRERRQNDIRPSPVFFSSFFHQ
ncbi:unnamed protein product, partial [Ilex paraguariensis]